MGYSRDHKSPRSQRLSRYECAPCAARGSSALAHSTTRFAVRGQALGVRTSHAAQTQKDVSGCVILGGRSSTTTGASRMNGSRGLMPIKGKRLLEVEASPTKSVPSKANIRSSPSWEDFQDRLSPFAGSITQMQTNPNTSPILRRKRSTQGVLLSSPN
eukprot:4449559-Pleurochrysis_carterae.AAC.1